MGNGCSKRRLPDTNPIAANFRRAKRFAVPIASKDRMSRLFHALVVMGAGVSVSSCGGHLAGGDEPDASTGGGAGAGGTHGAGGLGGSSGFSGIGGGGTGGSTGTGGTPGTIGVPAPFADAGVTTGDPLRPAPYAQYDCSTSSCVSYAAKGGAYLITNPCSLDATRPKSAADCPGGLWFECTLALVGTGLFAVNCQCTMRDCSSCDNGAPPLQCEGSAKLCPCFAYTGILK